MVFHTLRQWILNMEATIEEFYDLGKCCDAHTRCNAQPHARTHTHTHTHNHTHTHAQPHAHTHTHTHTHWKSNQKSCPRLKDISHRTQTSLFVYVLLLLLVLSKWNTFTAMLSFLPYEWWHRWWPVISDNSAIQIAQTLFIGVILMTGA